MNEKIFRKSSLDRLSSPEQLDMAITIMKPRSWLILGGLLVVILAVAVWGLVGKIDNTIPSSGIITSSGGSQEVIHNYSGMVTDVGVATNQRVYRGDVLARISQPDLATKITNLQSDLIILNSIDLSSFNPSTMIFTPSTDSVVNLYQVASQLKTGTSSMTASQFETSRKLEINKTEASIQYYQKMLKASCEIVSPADGIVSNIEISKDSNIQAGQALMSILQENELTSELQAIVYVDYSAINYLETGQKVKIAPAISNQANYGYLMGTVISVSDYPATQESITRSTGSPQLATALLNSTNSNVAAATSKQTTQSTQNTKSYVEVKVSLEVDSSTPSGYKWTSRSGPPGKLASGIPCSAQVVIRESSPIGLLIS